MKHYLNIRLCIKDGWSCGLITATSGSRSLNSVKCSVASWITAFTTLKILVAKSDPALLPFVKPFFDLSSNKYQIKVNLMIFLLQLNGFWERTYGDRWNFGQLYNNIRGRHVANRKSVAFHCFASEQLLDIVCLAHIECPVCRDHISWKNLDSLNKKWTICKYEKNAIHKRIWQKSNLDLVLVEIYHVHFHVCFFGLWVKHHVLSMLWKR